MARRRQLARGAVRSACHSIRTQKPRKTKPRQMTGAMCRCIHASLYVNICRRAESTSRHDFYLMFGAEESKSWRAFLTKEQNNWCDRGNGSADNIRASGLLFSAQKGRRHDRTHDQCNAENNP